MPWHGASSIHCNLPVGQGFYRARQLHEVTGAEGKTQLQRIVVTVAKPAAGQGI